MRCEVIAIGTELLLGQITDTNSAWIGEQLALSGIDSLYQLKVGDNFDRMVECIRHSLTRSDAVITCGGLGPTQDDITREAIAEVMGAPLVRQPEIGERIRHMFESLGRVMPENNLRQADVPEGASTLAEMPGTAPGLLCPVGEKVIYAVPGVPHEMQTMMTGSILPDLRRRAGFNGIIMSRVLRTWGHSESGLAELLAARIEALDEAGNPTLAFQASGIEGLKVRITVKAEEEARALAMLNTEEREVRQILGDTIFGIDGETMESVVLDRLREGGLTLAVAEITSGGLIAKRLTAIDASGEVFRGGIVPASGAVRESLLGVPRDAIGTAEAARRLAAAVRETLGADIGISTTGLHDLDEPSTLPPGTTFLGIATAAGTEVEQIRLPGDRERIRQYSVISLLNYLRLKLADK
ncbi:MAG TPA: CinA family nicotinamide mononucleotide deamidase-related protein [Alphaproteobacteria bacterium]|nr:CinA family nicotinamide mononucleotide deamidase-related protein [Alphaproteobacteria bacterium]